MQRDETLLLVEEGEPVWHKQPEISLIAAREAYTGEAYTKNREDVESLGHPWLILSAKHGFLLPDTVIEAYTESFNDPTSQPVTSAALRDQSVSMGLTGYSLVIAYGSWRHIARVKAIFRATPVTTGWSIEAQRRASAEADVDR